MKFIDAHYLVGKDYWLSENLPQRPHKEYLEEFNRVDNGMKNKCLIYPFPSSKDGKYTEENEIVYNLSKDNDNLIPVFALNINYKDCFSSVKKYLEKCHKAGIVIWPILCNIDVKRIEENEDFIKFSNSNEFFIYIHTAALNEKDIGRVEEIGNYGPQDAISFAKAFPNKKFILGHLLRGSVKALETAKQMDNVVIETSGISGHLRWFENKQNVFPAYDAEQYLEMKPTEILEDLINNKDMSDKIVFGSSYPFSYWWDYNLMDEINLIDSLKIDKKIKDKILYENIQKFLDL